jgi:Zn-dependent protease
MITLLFSQPYLFLVWLAAVVIVITIHEFAHAWAADRLGDETPRYQGRLTLNPLEHLDPAGTLLLVFTGYGWGKPVEFNPFALDDIRRGTTLVALAGPASNLILAALLAAVFRFLPPALLIGPGGFFLLTLVQFNVILAVFNLIPINPLDGFKVVGGFLPPDLADQWTAFGHYGIIILVVLLLPFGPVQPINLLIGPPIHFLTNLFLG